MTKKCLWSAVTFSVFTAICLIAMHLMLLATINKWVGICIGTAIFAVNLIIYLEFFRRSTKKRVILLSFLSAVGCGLAISSLYVHLKKSPEIWQSACVWGALVLLFLIYCLLTNLPIVKRCPVASLLTFGLIVLTGGIMGYFYSSSTVFSLALMLLVLFYIYLVTIIIDAKNAQVHCQHLTIASWVILIIVIFIVFLILSEGEGADAVSVGDGLTPSNRKKNPYIFSE